MKSNNTIELSTTIVRASPTPSEMQLIQNNNLSWDDHKSQMTRNRTKQLSRSPSALRNDIGCKSGHPKQLDPTSVCGKEQNSFSWQEHATKSSQILQTANMPQSALLEKYTVMQSNTANQCVSGTGASQPGVQSDMHKLPSSISSLLSGQTLSNAPYSQQCLGHVNPFAAFPGGNPGLYGAPSKYSCCNLPTPNLHSAVTGVPLSTNVGPGFLTTLPTGSHSATNQNIDHHLHMLENQPGATGLSQWASSRMSSGFGVYIHCNLKI